MLKFKKGDFEWKDKHGSVKFTEKENGRFSIKIWKPGLLRRFLYWSGIIKDPRYNGKKVNWMHKDEVGQIGCDPYDGDIARVRLSSLIYHRENDGTTKPFQCSKTENWYNESELLKIFTKAEINNIRAIR